MTDASEMELHKNIKEEEKVQGISPSNNPGLGLFDTENQGGFFDQIDHNEAPLQIQEDVGVVNIVNIDNDAPEEEPVKI